MALTDQDIAYFRAKLMALHEELASLSAMSADSRAPVTLDQSSVGRVSRIDAIQAQQLALATERQRTAALARVTAALARIEAGDYGECLTCGEDIARRRLEFDPAVPTCIACAR
ncbi:MAG: TraR/DksA C4-type zinc finger protein [Pseudomonadota bacterium]